MPLDCVIGLGSNLGDRLLLIERAASLVAGGTAALCSTVYETPPVGPPQPPFLNAALRLFWEQTPEALLERLLWVERRLGRVRAERWGPRTIDLDLLWIFDVVVASPKLVVPHPELARRDFALIPLLEVAPDACDPASGAPLATWRAGLASEVLLPIHPGWRLQ